MAFELSTDKQAATVELGLVNESCFSMKIYPRILYQETLLIELESLRDTAPGRKLYLKRN